MSYYNLLSWLAVSGAWAVFFTGAIVLALGDWSKFKLKFAAVAISTSAAFGLILLSMFKFDTCVCAESSLDGLASDLYHFSRSLAFVIFHIVVGRDAIHFKKCDRRGCAWMRKL